jgi:hypothetical protein
LNRLGSQRFTKVFSMTPKELGKTMASPMVDAEVSASLKSVKPMAADFPSIPGLNGVKTTVNVLTGIGYAVTGGHIYLDENTRPAF